ncbi:MAG TPA: hypothetical protein VHZ03_47385 [Trebonia sp.]|nr:hypothetical protein [Trebonia sp.]
MQQRDARPRARRTNTRPERSRRAACASAWNTPAINTRRAWISQPGHVARRAVAPPADASDPRWTEAVMAACPRPAPRW